MQKMALTTGMKHTLVEEDQAWEYLSKCVPMSLGSNGVHKC